MTGSVSRIDPALRSPRGFRLEVNVTYRCNAVCQDCNRAIGLAHIPNSDLSAAGARQIVEQVRAARLRVSRVTLAGGEPAMIPEIQGVLDAMAKLPGLRNGRLLSNGQSADRLRALRLPRPFHPVVAPIDDPADPASGKAKHTPFFVSPRDVGLRGQWSECRVRGYCGKGVDKWGWTMCGVAGVLGRLLGRNPYLPVPHARDHARICEHCIYGLSKRRQRAIHAAVERGEVPRVSPVYREGLKRYRDTRPSWPVLFGESESKKGDAKCGCSEKVDSCHACGT